MGNEAQGNLAPRPTDPGRGMTISERDVVQVYRRVLRLTDRYLRRQKQDLLITDGRSLMTWGEIRQHIRESLALKTRRAAGSLR